MRYLLLYVFMVVTSFKANSQQKEPVRIGIAGLTHTHVHWLLGREERDDIEIVGISESNMELAKRYMDQYEMPLQLVYTSLDEMIEKSNPEAVLAFGSIYEHLEVVEKCAPKGIHVMVEKPLAISNDHARKMADLAKKHNILLLTNYETTWYATTQYSLQKGTSGELGRLNRIVVNDGHQGPQEIGINQEFLDWLIDPEQNGAGALTDFGCYGANIITNMMGNEKPLSVTALVNTNKPNLYPKVDDDATILLQYPTMTGVIQASWNWTYGRKDMEVYGTAGYLKTKDGVTLNVRTEEDEPEQTMEVKGYEGYPDDPFNYMARAVRGDLPKQWVQNDLNSLQNNLIVVEILEAAMESARKGKTIIIKQ